MNICRDTLHAVEAPPPLKRHLPRPVAPQKCSLMEWLASQYSGILSPGVGVFVAAQRRGLRKTWHAWAAVAALAAANPAAIHAQAITPAEQQLIDTLDARMDQLPTDLTELRIGAGPIATTTLDSPGRHSIYGLPLVFFHYKEYVALDETELRLNVFAADSAIGSSGLRAGPMMKLDFGRRWIGARGVTGPGRVGTSLELGGFVAYSLGPARLCARVRQDVLAGHGGALVELDVRTGLYRSEHLTIGAQIAAAWASRKYLQSYFGVTSNQSLLSGLPVFTPGAGFRDVSLSFTGDYKISDHWATDMSVQYVRRLGETLHSPIVQRRGSGNRLNTGIFALYTF